MVTISAITLLTSSSSEKGIVIGILLTTVPDLSVVPSNKDFIIPNSVTIYNDIL